MTRKSEMPEYRCWQSLRQRCNNPNNPGYKNYGARGISVAPEWQDDFDAFYAYVGPRPPGKSIDRIENDGNYEPGNVRWATRVVQRKNARPKTPHHPGSELGRIIKLFGGSGAVANALDVDFAAVSMWMHKKGGTIPFPHKLRLVAVAARSRVLVKDVLAALDLCCPMCQSQLRPDQLRKLARGTNRGPRHVDGRPKRGRPSGS